MSNFKLVDKTLLDSDVSPFLRKGEVLLAWINFFGLDCNVVLQFSQTLFLNLMIRVTM